MSGVGLVLGGGSAAVLPQRQPILVMLVSYAIACGAVALTALALCSGWRWWAGLSTAWDFGWECQIICSLGNRRAKSYPRAYHIVTHDHDGCSWTPWLTRPAGARRARPGRRAPTPRAAPRWRASRPPRSRPRARVRASRPRGRRGSSRG